MQDPCSPFNLEPVREFLEELRKTREESDQGGAPPRPELKPLAQGEAALAAFPELRGELTRRFEELAASLSKDVAELRSRLDALSGQKPKPRDGFEELAAALSKEVAELRSRVDALSGQKPKPPHGDGVQGTGSSAGSQNKRAEAEVLGAGTVKFCGRVNIEAMAEPEGSRDEVEWIGIELDEERACAMDGVLAGIAIFSCKPRHGLLVKRRAIGKSPSESVAEGDRVTVLKTEAMPSTYAQALCLLGGQQCLQGFAELSRHIHSKYAPPKEIQELLQRRGLELKARSTTMNYQPYCSSMAEVYDFHRERKSAFDDRVRLIAEQTEGEALVPEMKGLARCESKAAFKYADDAGVSYYRLTDIVRATILYDSLASMYKGLDVIHRDKDIEIIEFNDRYLNHLAGYRDLQLSVRMHGMVAELQLNTRGMAHVKEHSGHRSFEVKRELVAMVHKGDAQKCYDILDWGRKELGDSATFELTKILNDPEKPMLQAASGGHAELVSVLLRFAADVSLKDNHARTALHRSSFWWP
ncbi:Pclo [Symbiodinium sp. CCMP2456]|nr:Pclo [Symbiodinium sp. CCMP2456]